MNYLALNAVFLAAAAAAALVALLRRPRSRALYAAAGLALTVVLILTAVFDNIMIGVGLVAYDPSLISGIFVGIAPLEDFAYPVAAALLLPALWTFLGGDGQTTRRTPAGGHGAQATPAVEGQDE